MKSILIRPLLLSLLVTAMVLGMFVYGAWTNERQTEVIFLDVEQADAILIRQGRNQILIDGGRSGKVLLSALSRHIPFWDRTIEAVISTHPDADHIGGFPSLIRNYRVGIFVSTAVTSESEVYRYLEQLIGEYPPDRKIIARKGISVSLPRGGRLEVLFPPDGAQVAGESNETSIVTRFSFGETDFLLTGDLPREEMFLPDAPESEVLKLAHHGSKSSSSEEFLARVRPQEAVVSVGRNSYGHPSPEVLDRARRAGAIIRRTDELGDIVYRCVTEANRCTAVSGIPNR